jgi:m7GpppX diphosphatase
VHTKEIRTLRDLTKAHIPLLNNIRQQANTVAKEKFSVEDGKLRMFIHYQPSYCRSSRWLQYGAQLILDHFHVHIVHIYHEGLAGMMVGQAHLLDDVVSLASVEGGAGLS